LTQSFPRSGGYENSFNQFILPYQLLLNACAVPTAEIRQPSTATITASSTPIPTQTFQATNTFTPTNTAFPTLTYTPQSSPTAKLNPLFHATRTPQPPANCPKNLQIMKATPDFLDPKNIITIIPAPIDEILEIINTRIPRRQINEKKGLKKIPTFCAKMAFFSQYCINILSRLQVFTHFR
jgi:hypothetical protein